MVMKKWINIVIYVVLVATIAVMGTTINGQRKHVTSLNNQVKEQSTIIDSLLKRRMTVFDVQLNVTDKSRNIIHGKYNKGTINMPQERTYKLEIDSTNIIISN